METMSSSFLALAVATIYLIWHYYANVRFRFGRTVQERVAYMLWTTAMSPE
jgi:hypothetical protein